MDVRTTSGLRTVPVMAAAVALMGCVGDLGTDPPDGPGAGVAPVTVPSPDSILAGLDMDAALAEISTRGLAFHIEALAHDSMKGRRTGRPEIETAAAYVAGSLAAAAVEPGADDYLVRWDLPRRFAVDWGDTLVLRPPNVLGLIRGSDPELAEEYVVVTAHYDHVGTGPANAAGDSIFNGADDNASGTAVLLEVAGALAALPTPPRRSVLFLAVSGEELGLLGSEAYMAAPTVPATAMVANINLDMVSRGATGAAFAIGHSLSTLGPLADAVTEGYPELGLVTRSDVGLGQDLMYRSDHFHFARNRIPAVGLFGGFHPDYHTLDDEVDRVDTAKAARIARLATLMVAVVAMMDERPEWTDVGNGYMQRYW